MTSSPTSNGGHMGYLAHGNGIDDIAMMVAVIVIGLLLLRRSERSVRTRAQEADADAEMGRDGGTETGADSESPSVESAVADASENGGNSA